MLARSSRRRAPHSRIRRLLLQPLEPRQLLTTFTVSTLVDESDGNFAAGDFSLREAIEQANLTDNPGGDTINFSSAVRGTITLSGSELLISKRLTITGPGANLLTVSGGDAVRVFDVSDAGNPLTVSLSGLTVSHGSAVGSLGGGILAAAGSNLTLDRMYLHDDVATQGGGVAAVGATLTILSSTIARNGVNHQGGAIYFEDHRANDPANPSLRVINSTISDNGADNEGGGVYVRAGAAQFRSSTIALNNADKDQTGGVLGGGLWIWGADNASATLYDTIIAGNTVGATSNSDIANKNVEAASASNVIGDPNSAGGLSDATNGNFVGRHGSASLPIDSILDLALANNGGATPTHALVNGSIALDTGDAALAVDQNGAALTKDQRGFARIVDGPDANTTATIDIGAYEAGKRTFVVNTLLSGNDGDYSAGKFSLFEAVERANANAGSDTINFAAGLTGTIDAGGGGLSLTITDALVINGPGADLLALDAKQSGSNRVVDIERAGAVSLSGVTIQGATATVEGGGIFVGSTFLTLNKVSIRGNGSTGAGGGLGAVDSSVTILNSSIYLNAAGQGGGISFMGSTKPTPAPTQPTLRIINSSILNNTAQGRGGGVIIGALGAALIRNSTIATNHSDAGSSIGGFSGGGVLLTDSSDAYCTLQNTIVAGNISAGGVPDDLWGKNMEASSANNLVTDTTTSGGLLNNVNGNIIGNNGGGTLGANAVLNIQSIDVSQPLFAFTLAGNSPALDKGNNSFAVDQNGAVLTVDQRGKPRIVDFDGNGTATVDMGAVELSPLRLTLSGTVTYTENDAPLVLAGGATFSGGEVPTFDNKALVVADIGANAGDRLTVLHQGNAAGQVGVSGANVRYGGVLIGTTSGGSGSTSLKVTFNADATAEAIQAVVRRVAFSSVSENPPTNARTIRFVVQDCTGFSSNTADKTVKVVRVNDPPVIGSFGSALTYTEDTAAIGVAGTATVSDVDSFNFDGGKLWIKISANAESSDRLSIRSLGGVSTSSNDIFLGGDVIGTFTGGSGSTALVITFNSLANAADVQAVLRAVAFKNTSQNPSSKTRTLSVILTDGDGGTSVTSTKSINVKPVNDKPLLGGISGSVGYVHNAAAIVVAGSATVTDVDSANFAGGRLRVRIDAADASNRLAIAGGFTVDASNNVKLNGVTIGTRTVSGFGTKDLIVVFNSNATKAIVQQLVRAITFKTVSGAAGSRKVIFSVSDGDGGLSAEVSKTVNVT